MRDLLKERLEEIKKLDVRTYRVIDLALDVALSDEELQMQGSYIYVLSFDGTDFNLKLNSVANDKIPIRQHRGIGGIYHRVFITHTAQAGKTIKLLFGIKTELHVEDWS